MFECPRFFFILKISKFSHHHARNVGVRRDATADMYVAVVLHDHRKVIRQFDDVVGVAVPDVLDPQLVAALHVTNIVIVKCDEAGKDGNGQVNENN